MTSPDHVVPAPGHVIGPSVSAMREELKASWENFRDYDAPLTTRVRMAVANSVKKAGTRQSCCGNPGQPGC
jgi:hypothetical protein